MEDNINNLIDYYTKKKREGLDFSEIRKELILKNYDPDTIKIIINGIDNQILNEELNKVNKSRFNELKVSGLILMIGGGVITLGTYFGIINIGGYYIIAYGPIIAGYFMILASRRIKSGKNRITGKKRYF